jgi:hypothetical protein
VSASEPDCQTERQALADGRRECRDESILGIEADWHSIADTLLRAVFQEYGGVCEHFRKMAATRDCCYETTATRDCRYDMCCNECVNRGHCEG